MLGLRVLFYGSLILFKASCRIAQKNDHSVELKHFSKDILTPVFYNKKYKESMQERYGSIALNHP